MKKITLLLCFMLCVSILHAAEKQNDGFVPGAPRNKGGASEQLAGFDQTNLNDNLSTSKNSVKIGASVGLTVTVLTCVKYLVHCLRNKYFFWPVYVNERENDTDTDLGGNWERGLYSAAYRKTIEEDRPSLLKLCCPLIAKCDTAPAAAAAVMSIDALETSILASLPLMLASRMGSWPKLGYKDLIKPLGMAAAAIVGAGFVSYGYDEHYHPRNSTSLVDDRGDLRKCIPLDFSNKVALASLVGITGWILHKRYQLHKEKKAAQKKSEAKTL